VFLRGEIQHKNLWLIDLETGAGAAVDQPHSRLRHRDFDISPDGREVSSNECRSAPCRTIPPGVTSS